MKPIKTKGTNAIFGAENCIPLPAEQYVEKIGDMDVDCIQTVWELTDDELNYINQHKRIYVSVIAQNPQPISLSVSPFTGEE